MTPEEKERIITDAFKDSKLISDLKLTPEERLLNKLRETTHKARNTAQVSLVKYPLQKDRALVQRDVQHTYFVELESYEKHELANLFAAFLTSHLLSDY